MNARLTLPLLTIVGAVALAGAPCAALAATTTATESVSSNWSGYVVKGPSPGTRFSKASGSWVQPSITTASAGSYAVFWVGLGGSGGSSNTLEQVGTEANYVDGKLEYYAWYELVPAGPVKLSLTIRPGDRIYAEVSVSGSDVTVAIADQRTGDWVKKTLQMTHPDTSSAEWIAEAPSTCNGSAGCRPLELANFGTVRFANASATAGGHSGSIDDPNWATEAVRMTESASGDVSDRPDYASLRMTGGGAAPSNVSCGGSSFSVSWSAGAQQAGSTGSPALASRYGPPR